jgi:hypothetical protein
MTAGDHFPSDRAGLTVCSATSAPGQAASEASEEMSVLTG